MCPKLSKLKILNGRPLLKPHIVKVFALLHNLQALSIHAFSIESLTVCTYKIYLSFSYFFFFGKKNLPNYVTRLRSLKLKSSTYASDENKGIYYATIIS